MGIGYKKTLFMVDTFQSNLEQYLDQGEILIGSSGECFFSAVFIFSDDKEKRKKVESDRGIRHLLLLLEAKLNDEEKGKEIIKMADTTYPYMLNHAKRGEIDLLLDKSLTRIFKSENGLTVTCIQPQMPFLGDPNLFYKQSTGLVILEEFRKLCTRDRELKPYPILFLLLGDT